MAQDWICQSLTLLSQKWQILQIADSASSSGISKTRDCLRRTLETKTIASAFSFNLRHQKQTVRRLNASPSLWVSYDKKLALYAH